MSQNKKKSKKNGSLKSMEKLRTKLDDMSTTSEAAVETLTKTVVGMLIAFLEKIFFEKSN